MLFSYGSQDFGVNRQNKDEDKQYGLEGTTMDKAMRKGIVLWFDDAKGYGFIEDAKGTRFFAHFSEVVTDQTTKRLQPRQIVTFEAGKPSAEVSTRPAKNIEVQS